MTRTRPSSWSLLLPDPVEISRPLPALSDGWGTHQGGFRLLPIGQITQFPTILSAVALDRLVEDRILLIVGK
jgi:hypothetical protein